MPAEPIAISAVIPAHNPDPSRLQRTLLGLRAQTFPPGLFEVVLVNNASSRFPEPGFFAECAPANFSIVEEGTLGLTAARLAGFAAARGDLIILVDDDNVLAADFLAEAAHIARDFPFLGSWSGNVELVFEPGAVPPYPGWRSYLAERECREATWSNDPAHNASTPWGAGMCVRRSLADAYKAHCRGDPSRLRLDLSGPQLVYGGDTDIAFFGCSATSGKGVFPQLRLRHLIPPERCTEAYLLRAIEGHAYSEWLHHWVLHGAVPKQDDSAGSRLRRRLRLAFADAPTRAAERAKRAGHERAARELGGAP
jgi:glycosyltransferase involved in cell wall biosynthesis